MINTILKKYKLISDDQVKYLFPDEIISITPSIDKNGKGILLITYWDDEFCVSSTYICNKIIVENYL